MVKIHDLELLENINILYDNKIILYGAGDYGRRAKKLLEKINIPVLGFGDSSKEKWGGAIEDKRIFSFCEMGEGIDKNTIVIITVANVNDVERIRITLNTCGISEAKCYTYFALKRSIELHINDKRIPESYREDFNISKMIYREWKFRQVELNGLEIICDRFLHNNSIIILQPAKVGSSSVKAGLERKQIACIHTHVLVSSMWGCNKFLKERIEGVKLLKKMEDRLKIISMIRDPIGRDISLYFQALGEEYVTKDGVTSDIYKDIYKHLEKNSKTGNCGWIFEWFNKEIKECFGIDVYQHDFDKIKGYQIIKKDNVELLLMKTEKLDDCQKIIGEFVGVGDFELVKENIGNNKPVKYVYEEVKKAIKVPKSITDFYYKGNACMDHFYTLGEKEIFIKRWGGHECG